MTALLPSSASPLKVRQLFVDLLLILLTFVFSGPQESGKVLPFPLLPRQFVTREP